MRAVSLSATGDPPTGAVNQSSLTCTALPGQTQPATQGRLLQDAFLHVPAAFPSNHFLPGPFTYTLHLLATMGGWECGGRGGRGTTVNSSVFSTGNISGKK